MKLKDVGAYFRDMEDVKTVTVDYRDGLYIVSLVYEKYMKLLGKCEVNHSFVLSENCTIDELQGIVLDSVNNKAEELSRQCTALEELAYDLSKTEEFLADNPQELAQYMG